MATPYTISISLLGNDTYFLDVGGEINEEGGGGSDTVVLSDELMAQTVLFILIIITLSLKMLWRSSKRCEQRA